MNTRFWLKMVAIAGSAAILFNLLLVGAAIPVGQTLPPGDKLAFMSIVRQSWDIFIMDVSRQLMRRITWDRDTNERYPAWSPDGKYIAYHSDVSHQWELYITSLDGRDTRQLTGLNQVLLANPYAEQYFQGNAMADWSPDGRSIGFHSDLGGDWDLYTVATNGDPHSLQQITSDDGDEVLLNWSPDGQKIVYTAGVDNFMMLRTKDLKTGQVTDLTKLEDLLMPDGSLATPTQTLEDWSPAWSPDGSRIVFTSNRSGSTDIYVINADGSDLVQLTDDFYRDYNPIWISTNEILFVSDRGGRQGLYQMDADGNDLRPLRLFSYPSDVDAPAWYP